ncbi:hypothetical protein TNCV_4968901 [Trichonephila clavipes]|nr:hypothetical protein TNCV_4968901 [Trichonephila clavipes]
MSRRPDHVVSLKRDPQCSSPQASLVLIYRPPVEGTEGYLFLLAFLMCFRRERKDTIGFSLVFRCHFVHACASGLMSSPVPRIHCNSCEKESTPVDRRRSSRVDKNAAIENEEAPNCGAKKSLFLAAFA